MFEVYDAYTGGRVILRYTEKAAFDWVKAQGDHADNYDYRELPGDYWLVLEDSWPEYESVMEMEKYQ